MRFVWLALCLLGGGSLFAAPPNVQALYPSGGQVGTEFSVEVIGSKLEADWPPQVWVSSEDVSIVLGEAGKLTAKISSDASPGPVLLRLYNKDGTSRPLIFVVGEDSEVMETGSNDAVFGTESVIDALPAVFNGCLEKRDDVDIIRLPNLKKGSQLVAQVDSYSLLTKNDPFLHLLNSRGHEISYGSISHNLDPVLVHTLPEDGDYYLQINALEAAPTSNVYFAGAKERVYRMRTWIGELPVPEMPEPTIQEDSTLEVPFRLNGVLGQSAEVDSFEVPLTKDQSVMMRVEARKWHSPVDAVLSVYSPNGSLLKAVDDLRSTSDAEYLLKAREDGAYKVTVEDRFLRGGEQFRYQLVVEPETPTFDVTTTTHDLVLKAGAEVSLNLDLTREQGQSRKLQLELEGLPEGVTYEAAEFPAKSGAVKVTFKTPKEASAFGGVIRAKVTEEGEDAQSVMVRATFQSKESRGDYLINEHPDLWLTVVPAAPDKSKAKDSDS